MSGQPNGMLVPTAIVTKLDDEGYTRQDHVEYRSYRALRKDLANQLALSHDGEVHVARSRKGQWGEWFEVWQSGAKGKPLLVREGWQ